MKPANNHKICFVVGQHQEFRQCLPSGVQYQHNVSTTR